MNLCNEELSKKKLNTDAMNKLRNAIDGCPVTVIIIGPSCSGKTTFLKELTQDNNNKYVRVDGASIQHWPTDPMVTAVIIESMVDEDDRSVVKLTTPRSTLRPKYMDIIRLTHIPRFFNRGQTLLGRHTYENETPLTPVSVIILMSDSHYHAISNDMTNHYLVELTTEFNQTITHPNGTVIYSGPSYPIS